LKKIRIPVDVIWKIEYVRGKAFVVPDFGKMRNAIRKKKN
jgi:hypothetical protein